MSTRKHQSYTREFKTEAVKLVLEQGYKQVEAARNLGIETSLLGKWVRAARLENDPLSAFPGKGHLKPADAELAEVKKQLYKVTRERDILKKAIAYFATQPE
jgi:transposase